MKNQTNANRKSMSSKFDESTNGLANPPSRRAAPPKFSLLLASLALAASLCPEQEALAQLSEVISDGLPVYPSAVTIPHWTASFSYGGVVYPYTMVGTDPTVTDSATVVPTAIIPVQVIFSDGNSLDGSIDVPNALNSPIFQGLDYGTGFTQYGDAIQRAEFWSSVSTTSPNWHTLLGTPTVYPTLVVVVPQNHGSFVPATSTRSARGRVDFQWIVQKMANIMNQLGLSPTTLPIFLCHDLFLTFPNGSYSLGFHNSFHFRGSNGEQKVQTYIYTTWTDQNTIYPQQDIRDVGALSHEVAEWLNDPFGNNPVPPWQNPGDLQIGQGNLEVGDVLEFFVPNSTPVTINGVTYHPVNEALLPWFARQYPSSAYQGAYSFPDMTMLTTYSQPAP